MLVKHSCDDIKEWNLLPPLQGCRAVCDSLEVTAWNVAVEVGAWSFQIADDGVWSCSFCMEIGGYRWKFFYDN